MRREISYEWSSELVRLGTRRFISRYAGPSIVGISIVLAIGVSGLLTGREEGFWWVIVTAPVIYLLMWVRYYVHATKILSEMPDRRISILVEEDSLTLQTSQHTSTIKWSLIKNLWSFPDVLLVFIYGRTSYTMIPTYLLDDETRRFIEDKVREHGGKVA